MVVSQDENEEITDDHDVEDELDNDADDLDDVDDGEDVSEHLVTEDSEEEAKENKATKVSCFKKKMFSMPGKCDKEKFKSLIGAATMPISSYMYILTSHLVKIILFIWLS